MGGVLEVAGIEGFLCNIEETMEASDTEGGSWRGFVSGWWNRFGTAEVGTGDLFDLVANCEPPLPLGPGNEKSQRTRLGKALGKMRDQVFDLDTTKVRIRLIGVSHQAKRWQLRLQGERLASEGNVGIKRSPGYLIENKGSGERGEHGERFSTIIRARTHTCKRV